MTDRTVVKAVQHGRTTYLYGSAVVLHPALNAAGVHRRFDHHMRAFVVPSAQVDDVAAAIANQNDGAVRFEVVS